MPHPKRPGPLQDGGVLGWVVWAIASLIAPEEQSQTNNIPSTSPNSTATTVAYEPQNFTLRATSVPCVPVASPFEALWDMSQNILLSAIVTWLIPILIQFLTSFVVDVLFVFLSPVAPPPPSPPNETANAELQQAKIEREKADREIESLKQKLAGEQRFAEDQRARAEERTKALATSDKRAQELERANARLAKATKVASDGARTAKMLARERVAGHRTVANALTREQQRSEQLERTANTHQGQASKWRVKAEEADNKITELQSQIDVAEMQPSEVPDTFAPSTLLKDQLAEAIAERDSVGEKLAAAEEQAKQLRQSQANVEGQLYKTVAAKAETETKADALKNRVAELTVAEQQMARSLVTEQERSASFETDKNIAEAAAKSLRERVEELEKSTSLDEKARADLEAKLTSSQEKLADAESTVTSLQAQLGEASAVKATSENRLTLAEEEKSKLVAEKAKLVAEKKKARRERLAEKDKLVAEQAKLVAEKEKDGRERLAEKEKAEGERAAMSRSLDLATARQTELEREKEAAVKRAKDAEQELSEAREKIAELAAFKERQEAVDRETDALFSGVNFPTNEAFEPFADNEVPLLQDFQPTQEDFQPTQDDGLFDQSALNAAHLPADFQFDFGTEGIADDAPAGPSQAQDEFNFAEPPEPVQQQENEPVQQQETETALSKFLHEWHKDNPAGIAGLNQRSTEPASNSGQQQVQQQQAGPTVPSSSFSFTPPSTVPTSTVPEQAVQPQQGGPSLPSFSFAFNPPSTVPTSAVPQQTVQPQQGGPSSPPFSFSFNPPSTVPTSTVPEQQGQPPQGGPIFGGFNFDSAPTSTTFSADLSCFSTNVHPSLIFTGQAQSQTAGPSNSNTREITDDDFADGFAEFTEWQQSGSGNAADPAGGAEHDAGSENKPENETREESSSESEEE